MCTRARIHSEPETLFTRSDAISAENTVRLNRDPQELIPPGRVLCLTP